MYWTITTRPVYCESSPSRVERASIRGTPDPEANRGPPAIAGSFPFPSHPNPHLCPLLPDLALPCLAATLCRDYQPRLLARPHSLQPSPPSPCRRPSPTTTRHHRSHYQPPSSPRHLLSCGRRASAGDVRQVRLGSVSRSLSSDFRRAVSIARARDFVLSRFNPHDPRVDPRHLAGNRPSGRLVSIAYYLHPLGRALILRPCRL